MSAPPISVVLALLSLVFIGVGFSALIKLWRRRRQELAAYRPSEQPEDAAGEEALQAPAAPSPPVVDHALLHAGLTRSQQSLWGRLKQAMDGKPALDHALLEELETILLGSDVGVQLTMRLMDAVGAMQVAPGEELAQAARNVVRSELLAALRPCQNLPSPFTLPEGSKRPHSILFVGVNGVGKTTTVGKLAYLLGQQGHKVALAAGDTFRAAAAEQLSIWAERSGARLVRGDAGADPASVIYNAMAAATAHHDDVLLADTAGRLHNKADLMAEVDKIRRAMARHRDGAPNETWLVVDATTGQNAIVQAEQFHHAVGLTGVVLTKLDGSAKGGVAVGIVERLGIPVRLVGLGEHASALQPFDPDAFVQALI